MVTGMYNYKLKMLYVLAITLVESIIVTALISGTSNFLGDVDDLLIIIRLFTTPLFVCLIGMKAFKQHFASISIFLFLFLDTLICSINNLGWESILVVLHLRTNWEALLALKVCYTTTIIFQLILYFLIIGIMKDRFHENCKEE